MQDLLKRFLKRSVKSLKNNNRIELKTQSEIQILKEAGQKAAKILKLLSESLKPGISTKQLDDIAVEEMKSQNVKPAFLGYRGFPASTCISINEELVHGIPKQGRIIKEGDIVSIDLGVIHKGFYGDVAATFPVGAIPEQTKKLLDVTKNSLDKAIAQIKAGKRLGDVSHAIQEYVESNGFSVVRDYVGHGIGRRMHEDPAVPNFGMPNTGVRLEKGLVIAIEPMVNIGDFNVKTLKDNWTVVTVDKELCAHFEHMIAITENGNEILTLF